MRTVLIGQGAIALRCLESLARHALTPVLVCSWDGSLAPAAARLGVRHEAKRAAATEWFEREGCDFLFSVRNPWIIPESILARVRRCAVNFHDSLLPRYAGLHATSWAICNSETEHGITWHEMASGIDTGRILKQVRVPIEPDDTAFSLNTKCFDRAVNAFDELLVEVREDRLRPFAQTGERSYFGGRARPEAAGTLDFQRPARGLGDLARALDFGPAANPLGLPKLWLGDRPVVVRSVRELPGASGAAPGTLVEVGARELIVATRTNDVALGGFSTLANEPLSIGDVARLAGLAPGRAFPALSTAQRATLTALHERVCLREPAWLDVLQNPSLVHHPYAQMESAEPAACFSLDRFRQALGAEPSRRTRAAAILLAYLGRLSRDDVFDVGVVSPDAHAAPQGYFAVSAPLRVTYRRDETFADFEARMGRSFQEFERAPTYLLDLPARTPEGRAGPRPLGKWPVALLVAPAPDAAIAAAAGLTFWFDPAGCVSLVAPRDQPAWQVEALDRQLATMAAGVAQDLSQPVAGLPWLDTAERERILVGFNDKRTPLPQLCVHDFVAAQAGRTPEAPAVRFGTSQLSYAGLMGEARRLAHVLAARGVRRGDRVVLCVERSVQVVVGMLGILEAGAAYVPVDPGYPRERVEAMIAQCQARCAVTRRHFRESLLAGIESAICFDGDAAELRAAPETSLSEHATPDDVAYVIFTSGSTGAPKGVEIRHVSLVNHSLAIGANYGLGPGDRMLCSASIGFDVAGEQIYPALFRGAAVVVRPEDLLESFTRFEAFTRAEAITAMILPTAFWHEWVREMRVGRRHVPETLRVLSVGTEKAQGEHLAAFQALTAGRVRFFQGYGPTETTVTCTMYVHDGGPVDSRRPLPIGRPLPNTEIYVLDDAMQPVPIGMEGEIYVGGIGLARGYAARPDLTRERFLPHPFDPTPGARLYKTGDVGCFLPDGQLVYVGRTDFQVKIRGYRVELGEIENIILSAPGVDECVVTSREDAPGARRLVAYVVARSAALDMAPIEALCAAKLPPYMVPSAFVRLSAFPLTPNLKVDRRALPAPPAATASTNRCPAVARDDVELVVANAFGEALGINGFGYDESFFELGGDSLAAVLVLERIRAACSANLSLGEFFAAPSVAALAAVVRDGGGVDRPTLIELKRGQGGLPLFFVCGIQLYVNLARAIDVPGPVYAVLLPLETELVRQGGDLPAVADLASQYVQAIRQQFPDGPYALGGVSFGGAVAYEMARQLRASGLSVPVLALFDTNLPRARLRGSRYWLARQARAVRHGPWSLLKRTVRRLRRQRETAATMAQFESQRLDAYSRALIAYDEVVRPYPGSVVLFRAFEPDSDLSFAPDRGWASLVRGGLTFHDYTAKHLDLLRPPLVDELARALSHHLRAVALEQRAGIVADYRLVYADERHGHREPVS